MAGTKKLRSWLRAGEDSVAGSRELLDAINVFPIADSDTGTNLHMTLSEGNRAVARLDDTASHADVVKAFSRGCLMGARGNSGVIVAQYMNAFLRELDARGGMDAADSTGIAASLRAAAAAAHESVGDPVDGTILTVADAAAARAEAVAGPDASPRDVAVAAVETARVELGRTHEVLEVAREAGVVDAGAAGLVLQLEALARTLGGADAIAAMPSVPWEVDAREGGTHAHGQGTSGAFEVMFVALADVAEGVEGEPEETLKAALRAVGDAVAITGLDHLWQAHVHTDHPERALDVALRFKASQAVVRDIVATHGADRADVGVVALTTAPGLAAELASSGAAVLVVPEPATVEPLDLQRVVQDASEVHAVVVAGAPALAAAVRGLPTSPELPRIETVAATTEAEVVAAIAATVLAGTGGATDPAAAMRAAIARTRTITSTADALAEDLLRLVGDDTDVATVILGRGLSRSVAEAAVARLAINAPHVEVQVFEGRQWSPAVILGAEAGA